MLATKLDWQRLADEAHATSRSKGWWSDPLSRAEKYALMHSEVSEALEDYRKLPDDPSCDR